MHRISRHIPAATYRVQFSRRFNFEDAAKLAPYLKQLGISHLYASPCLKAAPGSRHGYDVVDPGRVNPELGGEAGYQGLSRRLQRTGLGQVLDIVPNHMAARGRQNPLWRDVLMWGRASPFAEFFDIDWEVSDPKLRGKVLVPVLGDHYARCLAAGQIRLQRRGAEILVGYFDHEMPVCPHTFAEILTSAGRRAGLAVLSEMAQKIKQPPQADVKMHLSRWEQRLEKLNGVMAANPAAEYGIDEALAKINARPARLDRCLERQHYRLAYWRTAASDINYRRFFDINDLVGICVEKENVFREIHRRVLHWVESGVVDGLRIDHPDGLRDPAQYLRRLRSTAHGAWIVVEKILEPGERLPQDWPVDGTTGYDFLNLAGGLFVDAGAEKAMTALYGEITGESPDFDETVRLKKHQVLAQSFVSEITRLTLLLADIRSRHRRYRDLTYGELRRALMEVIACFPVYRTYIAAEEREIAAQDVRTVARAVEKAGLKRPGLDNEVWELFKDLLLLRLKGRAEADFVMRFQQLTGPAMAKGVEDTAFYCYNRLISLNEVGGSPARFGSSVEAFHGYCRYLQADWPRTMLSTATHDTKRGEDTRLRIHALSEIPDRWADTVRGWFRMNAGFRRQGLPDANTEYLLYQTLVGAWPVGLKRLQRYMEKAAREAKVHTSWTRPDERYESILKQFIEKILTHTAFIHDLDALLEPLTQPARVSSLAQSLLRLTAPGVPDLYQGAELWDLSLVDPDNRRAVDFERRRLLLAELDRLSLRRIMSRLDEGLPKLFVIRKALAVRDRYPEVFGSQSTYRPLAAAGSKAGHVVAFVRKERIAAVVPRLLLGLNGQWRDTTIELPDGHWRNVFTAEHHEGGKVPMARLLNAFPVGLLVKEGEKDDSSH